MRKYLLETGNALFEPGNQVGSRETRRWSIPFEMFLIVLAALAVLLAAKFVEAVETLKGLFHATR